MKKLEFSDLMDRSNVAVLVGLYRINRIQTLNVDDIYFAIHLLIARPFRQIGLDSLLSLKVYIFHHILLFRLSRRHYFHISDISPISF